MASIKGKNSGIERAVFTILRKNKIKFRKHVKSLPGTPDVVLDGYRCAIFVDGDFWHGYHFCRWHKRVSPYWRKKITSNMARDRRNFSRLRRLNWRVKRFWGHQIKKNPEIVLDFISTLKILSKEPL